jgi:hypothetical protein
MANKKRVQPSEITAKDREFIRECMRSGFDIAASFRAVFAHDFPDPKQCDRVKAGYVQRKVIREALAKAREAANVSAADFFQRLGVDADRIVRELARIGFTSMVDIAEWGHDVRRHVDAEGAESFERVGYVRVRDPHEIEHDRHAAISKLRVSKDGAVSVELHDKIAALMSIARLRGYVRSTEAAELPAVAFQVIRSGGGGRDSGSGSC